MLLEMDKAEALIYPHTVVLKELPSKSSLVGHVLESLILSEPTLATENYNNKELKTLTRGRNKPAPECICFDFLRIHGFFSTKVPLVGQQQDGKG